MYNNVEYFSLDYLIHINVQGFMFGQFILCKNNLLARTYQHMNDRFNNTTILQY